jgi:hypothetical protein
MGHIGTFREFTYSNRREGRRVRFHRTSVKAWRSAEIPPRWSVN